jgi:xeroderma pigmentosum group C-complementing protein
MDEAPGTGSAGGFLVEDIGVKDEEVLPTAGKYSLAELLDSKPISRTRTKRVRKESDETEEADFSGNNDTDEEQGGFEPDVGPRTSRRSRRAVVEDDGDDEDLPDVDEQVSQVDGIVGDSECGFLADDGVEGGFIAGNVEGADGEFIPTGRDEMDDNGGGFMVDEETVDSTNQALDNDAQDLAPNPCIGGGSTELHQDVRMRDTSGTPAPQPPTPVCDEGKRLDDSENTAANERTDRPTWGSEPPQSHSHHDTTDAPQQPEWQVHGLAEAQQHTWPADADDESDQSSMLSHDPEDEDAEPDWLESD